MGTDREELSGKVSAKVGGIIDTSKEGLAVLMAKYHIMLCRKLGDMVAGRGEHPGKVAPGVGLDARSESPSADGRQEEMLGPDGTQVPWHIQDAAERAWTNYLLGQSAAAASGDA